jgi:hypothetical protein
VTTTIVISRLVLLDTPIIGYNITRDMIENRDIVNSESPRGSIASEQACGSSESFGRVRGEQC